MRRVKFKISDMPADLPMILQNAVEEVGHGVSPISSELLSVWTKSPMSEKFSVEVQYLNDTKTVILLERTTAVLYVHVGPQGQYTRTTLNPSALIEFIESINATALWLYEQSVPKVKPWPHSMQSISPIGLCNRYGVPVMVMDFGDSFHLRGAVEGQNRFTLFKLNRGVSPAQVLPIKRIVQVVKWPTAIVVDVAGASEPETVSGQDILALNCGPHEIPCDVDPAALISAYLSRGPFFTLKGISELSCSNTRHYRLRFEQHRPAERFSPEVFSIVVASTSTPAYLSCMVGVEQEGEISPSHTMVNALGPVAVLD